MPAVRKSSGKKPYQKKSGPVTARKSYAKGSKYTSNDLQKQITAAAQRVVNKNIETQWSTALVVMSTSGSGSSGWTMGDLNRTLAATYDPTACMVFNLGWLSQPGQTNQAGYRIGQKINALSFKFVVDVNVAMLSTDCTYNWAVVRRRNDAPNQNAYSTPQVVSHANLGLFKPLTDGPFVSSSGGAIVPNMVPASQGTPIPTCLSAMRRNTDQWTFVSGASGSMSFNAVTAIDPTETTTPLSPSNPASASAMVARHKSATMTVPLGTGGGGQEWDFVTKGGSDIKGGNYFFVYWREGPVDFSTFTTTATSLALQGGVQSSILMELAYKDG